MVVDNMADVVDVDTACGNIGGDKNIDCIALEALDDRVALVLFHVAMKTLGRVARSGKDVRHTVNLTLHAAKYYRFVRVAGIKKTDHRIVTLVFVDNIVVL